MGKKAELFFSLRGQAVIELAIFGAILTFLVASIVQQGMSAAFSQNETLQSTRLALLRSYQTSRGTSLTPLDENGKKVKSASRNVASFLYLEDRLSPGVTRYGVADRVPLVTMGSGSLTNKLFWLSDWDDLQNDIPLFDLKVNGESFVLKTGVPIVYRVRHEISTGKITVEKMRNGTTQWEKWFHDLAGLFKDGDTLKPDAAKKRKELEEKLRYLRCDQMIGTVDPHPPGDVNPPVGPFASPTPRMEMDMARTGTNEYTMFSVIVANNSKFAGLGTNQPRFDLQRNGGNVPVASQPNFIWKWDWKIANDVMKEIDWENANFPSYDMDGDLKEEMVYHITKYVHSDKYPAVPDDGNALTGPTAAAPAGVWDVCTEAGGKSYKTYDIAVMDYTAGEMGSAGTETDPRDVPGLQQDTHVYSIAQKGTTMEIREGATFVGAQNLVTSFSQKSQFDIISREVQLNKNMVWDKTIADLSYKGFSEDPNTAGSLPRCHSAAGGGSCCAGAAYVYQSCFDLDQKRLYIRSRIEDKRGRMWVTKTD